MTGRGSPLFALINFDDSCCSGGAPSGPELASGARRGHRRKVLAMAKVSPYHSSNLSDPDVYHDHDDCPTGKQIPSWNKVPGTGGYRKCKDCADLG